MGWTEGGGEGRSVLPGGFFPWPEGGDRPGLTSLAGRDGDAGGEDDLGGGGTGRGDAAGGDAAGGRTGVYSRKMRKSEVRTGQLGTRGIW